MRKLCPDFAKNMKLKTFAGILVRRRCNLRRAVAFNAQKMTVIRYNVDFVHEFHNTSLCIVLLVHLFQTTTLCIVVKMLSRTMITKRRVVFVHLSLTKKRIHTLKELYYPMEQMCIVLFVL